MGTKFYLPLIFYTFVCIAADAQITIPITKNRKDEFGPAKIVVKLDPLTRLPIGNVPFDRTFILRVYFDPKAKIGFRNIDVTSFYLFDIKGKNTSIKRLDFYLINSLEPPTVIKYDETDKLLAVYPSAVDIVIPALFPDREYVLRYSSLSQESREHYLNVFKLFYDGKIAEGKKLQSDYKTNKGDDGVPTDNNVLQYYNEYNLKKIYDDAAGNTAKANTDIVQFMMDNSKLNIVGVGNVLDFFNPWTDFTVLSKVSTYVYTIQSSSKYRIVADGGVIYTGWQEGFNSVTAYVGINISFRPIDTDIPFRWLVKNKRIKFCQRFTANLGLSLNSIAKDNYRANLFGNNNVMIGTGFKLSHAFNLNLGGLLYNNIDPNPLIAKKTLGVAPYAGISINLLIKDALGDIAKVFTYGK